MRATGYFHHCHILRQRLSIIQSHCHLSMIVRTQSYCNPRRSSSSSGDSQQAKNHDILRRDPGNKFAIQRTKNPYYTPSDPENIGKSVFVLAPLTTRPHLDRMTSLRQSHFNQDIRQRVKVGAHISLFHALPETKYESIVQDLEIAVKEYVGRDWRVDNLKAYFHGREGSSGGIYIAMGGPGPQILSDLRESLAKKWYSFLSPQDRKPKSLHYTIFKQKHFNHELALSRYRAVTAELNSFSPAETSTLIRGLQLHRYNRGIWLPRQRFLFTSRDASIVSTVASVPARAT